MKASQYVICPACRVREQLTPGPTFSYMDMWAETSRRHQIQGCQRWGYGVWGFDPMWDQQVPRTRRLILRCASFGIRTVIS